jgi:glycosyltransferase involved in cell wall biosynthesis
VKVLVLPRDENPYQGLLYGAMDPREVEVRYLDGPTSSQTLNLLALPLLLVWYRIRGFRLLHIHWVHPFLLAWVRSEWARGIVQRGFESLLALARALGFRIVWTAHNLLPHERVFRDDAAARRVLMAQCDAVIAHSGHAADEIGVWGSTRVAVIPQGIEHTTATDCDARRESRRRLGLDPARTVVCFFGKVLEYKGIDLLLDAVGALPPSVAIDVLVLGLCRDDDLRTDLESRAAWGGARVHARFEFVPDAELAAYLAAADYAVFPFRTVTNSSSVATALGAGLPVIVPRLAALDDLPDDACVRYEPGSRGLVEALARAAATDLQTRMALRAGAERCAEERTWSLAATATRHLYDEVLGEPVAVEPDSTMKALVVTPYPPKPDGIGAHTRELVDALGHTHGVSVDVLTSRRPTVDVPEPRVHRLLSNDPRGVRETVALLRQLRPGILHYQFAIPALGLSALTALGAGVRARRADPNLRLVVTLHEVKREIDLLGPAGRGIYLSLVAIADAVIVHTTEARDLVAHECGADPRRVWSMPLGAAPPPLGSLTPAAVDAVRQRFRLSGHEPGGRPLALCFGYLHPDKGIEHLIEAVARLHRDGGIPQPGLDVIIAGTVRPRSGVFRYFERQDREYELALRRAVEQHRLGDSVRFVGFVDSIDVPALLAAARVVVVPYTKVTQSSVLGMATVAGAPVIASDLPGLHEALGDGGLLVPPGDAEALAAALGRILTDDALAGKLRDAQKRRGAETGFDSVSARLVEIYGAVRAIPSRSAERRSAGAG